MIDVVNDGLVREGGFGTAGCLLADLSLDRPASALVSCTTTMKLSSALPQPSLSHFSVPAGRSAGPGRRGRRRTAMGADVSLRSPSGGLREPTVELKSLGTTERTPARRSWRS